MRLQWFEELSVRNWSQRLNTSRNQGQGHYVYTVFLITHNEILSELPNFSVPRCEIKVKIVATVF